MEWYAHNVNRYDVLLHDPRSDPLSWIFLAMYLVVIVFGWLEEVFVALLLLSGSALLLTRVRRQYIECHSNGIVVHFLFGPAINIRYKDISSVTEVTRESNMINRASSVLASAPGFELLNFPAVLITLTYRRWFLLLTPFPLLSPARKLRVPVANASEFVRDLVPRLELHKGRRGILET